MWRRRSKKHEGFISPTIGLSGINEPRPGWVNMKKRQQRKYVRFDRAHSILMWRGYWKEFEIDNSKKLVITFMDDSSRLITCYVVFDSPALKKRLPSWIRDSVPVFFAPGIFTAGTSTRTISLIADINNSRIVDKMDLRDVKRESEASHGQILPL
jgi:hypothetical protein